MDSGNHWEKSKKEALAELVKIEQKLRPYAETIKQTLTVKTAENKKAREKTIAYYNDQKEMQKEIYMKEINRLDNLITARNMKDDAATMEDITTPVAYSRLMAQKKLLEGDIEKYNSRLLVEKEVEDSKLRKAFMAKVATKNILTPPPGGVSLEFLADPIPKPKPEMKLPKKVTYVKKPEPTEEELEAFAIEQKKEQYISWHNRQRRILNSQEPLPSPSDAYWEEAKEVFSEYEYNALTQEGDLYNQIKNKRQAKTEAREAQLGL